MTRALMLLIAAAVASSAAGESPCKIAFKAGVQLVVAATKTCYLQHQTEYVKFSTTCPGINATLPTVNDAARCDPILFNFSKCLLQSAKLLKPDNTFDDVAFQTIALKNQCSTDTNFSKVYSNCKTAAMKYLNVLQFLTCIIAAMP
ncbi:uncharacterized protein LOC108668926 [Hyalella azteca]|uniref:Uncharacterized protein LOC108668926 n=1 Tax=Hyalella azteca TaxID=294128 RepID=A0A8B7NDJ6_HYAAZ|nr:uncharacterized protein LOC108668926 [Hyalella azteca]